MMRYPFRLLGGLTLAAMAACAPPASAPTPDGGAPRLPPIPAREGALDVEVVYPGEGATLGVRDSTFIFGNVGTGGASLTINGAPVEVRPNGAFLAFLPIPQDGVYRLAASAGGATDELTRRVKVPASPAVPAAGDGRLSVVPGSHMPRGAFTLEEDEPLEFRFRGTPGGQARVVIGDRVYPLSERPLQERSEGFMLERATTARGVSEYVGTIPARALRATDTAAARPRLAPVESGARATLELIRGADTVRAPVEANVGVLSRAAPRVGVVASTRPDGQAIGTAVPGGGTPYHWFFPNDTRLVVTGERAGEYRVRLSDGHTVWVDTSAVRLLPAGTPASRGSIGSVRATASAEHVDIRLATSERLPFFVEGAESGLTLTVYGAETRTNWLQYGATDPLIERMRWEQVSDDAYRLHVDLSRPLWGYRAFYDDAGRLILRVRRTPPIDARRPLQGLYIGIDAGHPPGGAVGPTGYTEADANLAISKRLIAMLREAGARVLETRPDTAAVGLGMRPQMATDSSVHLLVSVHNNAFPDGVNPFENNGTSVFYNAEQSLDLARALQHELLAEFRLRDLGIARADLALVRPTWMPSALTETMFLMLPEQEAALKDPAVQERIARAHLRGLESFVRARAGEGR